MRAFVRHNSLSLFFGLLFVLTLVGQSVAGWHQFNALQSAEHLDTVAWSAYVASSDFAVDVAENWQSEFLQFWVYLMATIWLLQKGSPESKELDKAGRESEKDQKIGRYAVADSPAWAKAGGWRTGLLHLPGGRDGLHLPGLVAGAVGGRLGRLQRSAARAAAGPPLLGRLPAQRRLLGAHPAELAERVPGGRHPRRPGHLPPAARVVPEQAGRRAPRSTGVEG